VDTHIAIPTRIGQQPPTKLGLTAAQNPTRPLSSPRRPRRQALGHCNLEARHVPELLPYRAAQVAQGHRLAVCDEESLSRGRPRGQQVGGGEHVRVGGVGDVDVVLQVCAGPEAEGRLVGGDAGVHCRDYGWVVGADYRGAAQRAGGEGAGGGVGGEDEALGFGLGGACEMGRMGMGMGMEMRMGTSYRIG
jgi:hypothetical protein